MLNGYDDFSLSMSFFEIAESFGQFSEWITSIYDGYDLSGLKQFLQHHQILLVYLRSYETHLLAPN